MFDAFNASGSGNQKMNNRSCTAPGVSNARFGLSQGATLGHVLKEVTLALHESPVVLLVAGNDEPSKSKNVNPG